MIKRSAIERTFLQASEQKQQAVEQRGLAKREAVG
jgi:hypothetical protein